MSETTQNTQTENKSSPIINDKATSKESQEKIATTSSSNESDSEQIVEAAKSSEDLEKKMDEEGLTENEKNSLRKKYEIKVDGQTYLEEIDLNDDEAIKKHLQLSKAATKRFQESSQLKKDVEAFFNALKGNTKQVLSELGIDPKKFAEQVINDELMEMDKTPEQKEKEKLQKELEDMKKKLKAEEEAKKEAEIQRLQEKYALELDQTISNELEKSKKLPKSPFVVRRVADALLLAYKKGYTNVDVKDIIPVVEKEIIEELQGLFGAAPEDAIEAIIGKGNIDRLRKNRLQKAKKSVETANSVKSTGSDIKNEKKKEEKPLTYKEFFSRF